MSMVDELPPLGQGDTLYDELFNDLMEEKWQPGIQQGREEGRAEGQHQTLITAVHNMHQQGFDVATIAKCLSISEAKVQLLQADFTSTFQTKVPFDDFA